jgi:GAF domain-containing protein
VTTDSPLPASRRVFGDFDIGPADLAYLQSVEETLTPEIQEWIVAQWQAEIETLPWFEQLGLPPGEVTALFAALAGFLRRLLSGDRVAELYGEIEDATLVALRRGVRNTDVFQASTKLESVLTGVTLQLFPEPDQQTVALVTLAKFLKSLLYVVMETYRRAAADEIEGRNRELASALDQQTATTEVLQVINSSPGDLAPVFDAVLEKAARLCETAFGMMMTWDGERFHRVAFRGVPEGLMEVSRHPMKPLPGTFADQLVRGENIIFSADLREAEASRVGPGARDIIRFGARTNALVALRKDDKLLGSIAVYRTEVRPFTEKQLALLQNFAAQAVIAMENARLLTETREALERQTATAEILRVISSSPTDVQPTFDAIAAAAATLSGAANGIVCRFDGRLIHFVAHHGLTAAEIDAGHSAYPLLPGRDSVAARAILT